MSRAKLAVAPIEREEQEIATFAFCAELRQRIDIETSASAGAAAIAYHAIIGSGLARRTHMRFGCLVSIGLLLVATVFLFMMANPVGWVLAALFGLAAVIVTAVKGVDWTRFGFRKPASHRHGSEDIGRGPDDDPMLR